MFAIVLLPPCSSDDIYFRVTILKVTLKCYLVQPGEIAFTALTGNWFNMLQSSASLHWALFDRLSRQGFIS